MNKNWPQPASTSHFIFQWWKSSWCGDASDDEL